MRPITLEQEAQQESEQPRVYVACLASYVSGILHGKYVRSIDSDELWQGIGEVLSTSPIPNAEEHAFHDYENYQGIRIGEYDSVDRVTALGRLVLEHDGAFACWYSNDESVDLDEAEDKFLEAYIGDFADEDELAAHVYAEHGIKEIEEEAYRHIPEWVQPYLEFDTDAYLRALQYNSDMYTVERDGRLYAFWQR